MNPILINPKIDDDKSTIEQLQQMRSYLYQFKEQIEFILGNIDGDNISREFTEELTRKVTDSKTLSEIKQTASSIRMSVDNLNGTVSALTVSVGNIRAEVYDEEGQSRIEQNATNISACVRKGREYSGISLSAHGVTINSTGSFTIDTDNLKLDASGNLTAKGNVQATSGNIGAFKITSSGLATQGGTNCMWLSGSSMYVGGSGHTYLIDSTVSMNSGANSVGVSSSGVELSGSSIDIDGKSVTWKKITFEDTSGRTVDGYFLTNGVTFS